MNKRLHSIQAYKSISDRLERVREERDSYFQQVMQYREWFLANQELLKTIPTTAPPYTNKDETEIIRQIRMKYDITE